MTSPTPATHVEGWPAEGLEAVPRCPLCGSADRSVFLDGLTDEVFDSAPGEWTLQRCAACALLYLDPRPTLDTIGRAYETYYTHDAPTAPGASTERAAAPGASVPAGRPPAPSAARRFLKTCKHGYLNRHFGTHHADANALGGLAFELARPFVHHTDADARHLPRPAAGADRLLDVGSGSGAFLDFAADAGWEVLGVDFDPVAVASARARGHRVIEGTLEALDDEPAGFDAVTASHILEHVHEPRAFVAHLSRLTRPGGFLWLETPNAGSRGLARFGRHWRGLEPPRHLAIFDQANLRALLEDEGFTDIRFRNRGMNALFLHAECRAIRDGTRKGASTIPLRPTLGSVVDEVHEYVRSAGREFLSVTATKG